MPERMKQLEFEHGYLRWRELGEGPPLVMLHGWSMSHAVFSELAEMLKPEFRLLIPDLPGHGGSAMLESCSFKSLAGIMAAWLQQLNLSGITLLGWSFGGQLALQLSAEYPQLIERLLLVSSSPRFCTAADWPTGLPKAELGALHTALRRRYLATMGEFFDLQFKDETLDAERRREILRFAVRSTGLPPVENALALLELLGRADLRPLLQAVEQSTLVIHGEIDRIIPLAAGRFLAKSLPAAQLLSLPGVGHAPFLSRPAQFKQLITGFCV